MSGHISALARTILMLWMLGSPFVLSAGSEPTQLTLYMNHPDPVHAHYGYVVAFKLAPTSFIPDPVPEFTGTITATDGQSECTATLPQLSCVLLPMAPGILQVEATYSGNGFYAADDAGTVSHEVLPFTLPEIASRGAGIGPGLFTNEALDIAISADGQHIAVAAARSSIFTASGETPEFGVFVYDIPERNWDFVSVNSDGTPGNRIHAGTTAFATSPSISANGRWVAFETYHSDLGGADPADIFNVYLFDRDTRTLYWVSKDMSGMHGRGKAPSVSDDGMRVAFESDSANLVPNDTNIRSDIFVWNRTGETLQRVSVDVNGNQGTDTSSAPSISGNGQYVAFQSTAPNLVANDNNSKSDIFVYNLANGVIQRVSLDNGGAEVAFDSEEASISNNGNFVAFSGLHLTPNTFGYRQIYVRDRQLNTITVASQTDSEGVVLFHSARPAISADGRFVTFETDGDFLVPGDNNGLLDVFLRDTQLQTTERVSVATGGGAPSGPSQQSALSNAGQRIVFLTSAQNLVEIPVLSTRLYPAMYDRGVGHRPDIRATASPGGSLGNADSSAPVFSGDGRYVAFSSQAGNLAPGDTNNKFDIFVRDRESHSTERVSLATGSVQGNGDSLNPGISSNGRYVAFSSTSTNFAGNPSGYNQIYVIDRDSDTLNLVSRSTIGTAASSHSTFPAISSDGNYIAFYSAATDLVQVDTNGSALDLFIYNRLANTVSRVISPGDSGVDASGGYPPAISADGRYTAFVTGQFRVWLWDRVVGSLIPTQDEKDFPFQSQGGRLGLSSNGQLLSLNAGFQVDFDFVNKLLIYDFSVHEWDEVATDYYASAINADGRFVVAQKQTPGSFDIFLFDTSNGLSRRISQQTDDIPGYSGSERAVLSADGRFIGFQSTAPNLVPNDTNGRQDVFVFENPWYNLPPGVVFKSGFENPP